MVSIPDDGEKCKRVNLRCGEKVEKTGDKSENREKEREKEKEVGGGGGKRGNEYRNISAGFRAELDFRLIRKSLASTCAAVGNPRPLFPFSLCVIFHFRNSVCRPKKHISILE